jgi:hypothetical protein
MCASAWAVTYRRKKCLVCDTLRSGFFFLGGGGVLSVDVGVRAVSLCLCLCLTLSLCLCLCLCLCLTLVSACAGGGSYGVLWIRVRVVCVCALKLVFVWMGVCVRMGACGYVCACVHPPVSACVYTLYIHIIPLPHVYTPHDTPRTPPTLPTPATRCSELVRFLCSCSFPDSRRSTCHSTC